MLREVLRRGEGNPAALRAMLYDAAQTRAVSHQDVRDLQSRDDAPYFNMGLVYVFALVAASLVRVLMIGMRSTDLYVVLDTLHRARLSRPARLPPLLRLATRAR